MFPRDGDDKNPVGRYNPSKLPQQKFLPANVLDDIQQKNTIKRGVRKGKIRKSLGWQGSK